MSWASDRQSVDVQEVASPTEVRPSIAVVVPVRNEARHIAGTLDQLLAQELAGIDLEILVVDGRSTDGTREIVAEYAERLPMVRLLDNPNRLSSSARNVAIEQSTSDYLVVIDGHCEIPNRTYFQDLIGAFDRTQADCLGRPQPLDVSEATRLQKAVAAARSSPLGHHPASYIYSSQETEVPAGSVAIAYRRSVFDRIGAFDPNFDACEDYELNTRIDQAGMSCYLVPSLAVWYHPRDTLRGLFRQLARYGVGRVRLWRKHGGPLPLMSFAPAAFLSGVIVGSIVCAVVPALWYAYWGIVGFYLAVVLAVSIQIAFHKKSLPLLMYLPFVFLAVHMGSAWGVMQELTFGKRLWQ